jgi:tetratricopeptide (TPR) repeat protein
VFLILGLLDAVLLLAMPKAEFDYKYNGGKKQQSVNPYQRAKKENYTLYRTPAKVQGDSSIARGIEFYKKEAYAEAILSFKRALEEDPDSAAAHFNLACCYAILQNAEDSYPHLALAVELGFNDFDRIQNHEALSFLRRRDDFKAFQQNGYRVVQQLSPGTAPDTLELRSESRESVLDQLEHLGEKLERGELSRDEFDAEKKKLLRS